jgi:HEAT repeat protein
MKLSVSSALVVSALALAAAFAPATWARPQDAASIVAELKKNRDEADPALIAQLGNLRTRDAMTALVDLYDSTFGSIFMRREVIKALGLFDGVTDAEQPALQKITDVATAAKEPELRAISIDVLAECRHMGKHFLKTIVESGAEDDLRERAMEKVVRMAAAEDKDFFERVFKGPEGDKDKKDEKKSRKDKDAEPEKKVHSVKSIRELAFEQIAKDMAVDKLYEYARGKDKDGGLQSWGVRRLALLEIESRKDKGVRDLALEVYEDNTERGENRAEAARILAEADGAKIAPKFLEDGRTNEGVSADFEIFRVAMADQLARMRDDATDKKLVKLVGKGKAYEQRFVLRALRGYKDAKLAESLAKSIQSATKKAAPKDNDPEYNDQRDVVLATIDTLVAMGDKGAIAALQGVVDACTDALIVAGALDGIGTLRGNDAEWRKQLETYAANARVDVRNAALMQLGKSGDAKYVAILAKALDDADWSTRAAALDGLAQIRTAESVAAIVGRMDKESGLMLVRFADALWKLTGKPHRTAVTAWKAWWEREGKGFTPISLSELSKLEADEEIRRLKQTTKAATFFGIRILSHRVIFVLDQSGSMNETLRSEYVGKTGRPRIEVAKEELTKCIEALEPESLFNIIVFSSDVDHWLDGGIAQFSQTNKDEAKKYVAAIGANGATNLYDAMRQAFADPDVDTIFVLSDGEPTSGEETDPMRIRERVRHWNEHRKIVIHTIAVGGSLQILEWLAQDSGGSHREFQ